MQTQLQTYWAPEEIGHGKDGRVFQISKDLVAKIGYNESLTKHDAEIAARLYDEGISVPRPYGVHSVTFPRFRIPTPFF